eukprot:CAMPEP_0178460366 /NCGR_PEP_ID=MMETSP0689_2-20121128/48662_1 /TAXON_ID=160604 /ORGANISM="Amphidinium massartii, Strain CS-259" /LENGTH=67 /DNA_ID=CAMNT_0020086979 /DNA_START=308 /DNA_END=508 /DNA_ORIENTATION=+
MRRNLLTAMGSSARTQLLQDGLCVGALPFALSPTCCTLTSFLPTHSFISASALRCHAAMADSKPSAA